MGGQQGGGAQVSVPPCAEGQCTCLGLPCVSLLVQQVVCALEQVILGGKDPWSLWDT